ncbi:MAG: LCP family protein [Defluviitaleaceae bacterium]|nr:LCP family protein [Defluviitaleaceae bacterium]
MKNSQTIFQYSLILMSALILIGCSYFDAPPVVPTHVEIPRPVAEDSALPEILTVAERKPLFFTFLIFGLDRGNNADAIIVAGVDIENGRVYTISVPRDTLVDAPRRLRKPVAAYSFGRRDGGGHDGGVAQMNADMQTLFGFAPDFYVSVNYRSFVRVVDSVGGVEINVPFHMRYDDPTDNLRINIPAGVQVLDGERALQFARFRMANPGHRAITDYARMENQQQVILALFDELLSPQTITRVPELVSIYREYVNTDLTYREMLWFASRLDDLVGAEFSAYTLPTTGTSGPPGWYELPDKDAILELVNRTVNPFTIEITAGMLRIAEQ